MTMFSASTPPGFPLAGGFAPRLVSAPAAAHLLVSLALFLSVSSVCGVLVMRSVQHRASFTVEDLAPFRAVKSFPPVAPLIFDEERVRTAAEEAKASRPGADLSESERYALLFMSRQQLAREVAKHMRGDDPVPPATTRDYRALAERGLAEVLPGQRYHSLTVEGARMADQVSRWLAKERGVHFIWDHNGSGYTVSTHCACGWYRTFSKNQGHIESQRMRAVGRHFEAVEAAKTKQIERPKERQKA